MVIFSIKKDNLVKWQEVFSKLYDVKSLVFIATILSVISIIYCLVHDTILSYGDSESHINIAKRVVDSLTPGLAQLGGIWLPLPHLMMIPFVKFDLLWRTGLAGSIVGGACFVVGAIYIYKLTLLITKNKLASFISFLVFVLNPNILYLQTTPLTEIPLTSFIIISIYYFAEYLKTESILGLVLAALFGLCATLSRYDGWFLVALEALIIFLRYVLDKSDWKKLEGLLIMFGTLAFVGILLWFVWGWLILGDPLYFLNSVYSAKSQQMSWLSRGQLPGYHNIAMSFLYYFVDSMTNIGVVIFGLVIIGFIVYLKGQRKTLDQYLLLLLISPFIFNVLTLFLGESVIFIPQLTPLSFGWRLFNARYGSLMVPAAAFFVGYLFYKIKWSGRWVIVGLMIIQLALFRSGYSNVITAEDGVSGLSSANRPDAERWMHQHYNGGLVLIDDYARSISIIRSNIPMQDIIYVGTKPYWDQSMKEPERYATWIVMQKNDAVWKGIYENPKLRGRLYKYFNKVYTSPNVLIFKRIT